jgi:hypothetical protein
LQEMGDPVLAVVNGSPQISSPPRPT